MATKDILGTHKVRTKPEYTAKTHWAGLVNFDAIFMAPILYLLVPVLLLYLTKCFQLLSNLINQLAGKAICNQYLVMGVVALVLWQFVVCIIWWKQTKAYEIAPKYEYHFYNDIIEYKACTIKTPKFISILTLLIFLVPTVAVLAGIVIGVLFLMKYVEMAPPSGSPSTPGEDTTTKPGVGSISIDWAGMWSSICETFNNIYVNLTAFVNDEANRPLIIVICIVIIVIAAILVAIAIYNYFKKLQGSSPESIKAKTLPARTLPAIISAVKKLPAPSFMVPENCPRWLKKIIFWAPVHYNFGDVIISSPKGACDDVVLSKIESPEKLVNYLKPIKPKPTEVAGYSAKR